MNDEASAQCTRGVALSGDRFTNDLDLTSRNGRFNKGDVVLYDLTYLLSWLWGVDGLCLNGGLCGGLLRRSLLRESGLAAEEQSKRCAYECYVLFHL